MSVYQTTANGGPGPSLTSQIQRLPSVERVETIFAPPLVEIKPNGTPNLNSINNVVSLASLNGLNDQQDLPAILRGRPSNPHKVNEMVVTASAAKQLKIHLGEVVPFGLYTNAQFQSPDFGTPKVVPRLLVHERIVGIAAFNTQVVQDDVDRSYGFLFLTPALLRHAFHVMPGRATAVAYGIRLKSGNFSIVTVEHALVALVPRGYTYQFHVTSHAVAPIQLAIKPESLALEGFGAIAALVCLVLAAQALSRALRSRDEDNRVLRALGARPIEIVGEGLVAAIASIVTGTLLALLVAVLLSPLSPIGPVRSVYPARGFAFDPMVLGFGSLALIGGLAVLSLIQTLRNTPHRHQRRLPLTPFRPSRIARAAQTTGLSIAGVMGVHFAVERGGGRTAVPVRSVMMGTILAVAMVVTTLTFASGLSNLVSHPPLYGWNWNYALNPSSNVPPSATALLSKDPRIKNWSGANYTDAEIDGQLVPILLMNTRPKVSPPILAGHTIDTNGQIVLGSATLALLHKKVGDTVSLQYGTIADAPAYIPATKLEVVGVATFPAVGYASFVSEHTSMGTGALVPNGVQPPAFRQAMHSPDPNLNGPALVFVRLRPHVRAGAGLADLRRIARATNKIFNADPRTRGNALSVLSVERPVQIVNYRSIGSTPLLLALGLAVGTIGALGLTLASSVRKRRRDLAMLKTLGFIRRQITAAIAWQSTVDAVVGIFFGVPLGVVAGRQLWTLFARTINAVPDPTVPVLSVALVAAGALLFTNVVAALPGRSAARIPIGLVLRAE
jgi:hypothetical protein